MASSRHRAFGFQPNFGAGNVDINVENADDFKCSVCREILNQPEILPCSHKFCKSCLSMSQQATSHGVQHLCPYCRQPYSPYCVRTDHETRSKIRISFAVCKTCGEKVQLTSIQDHEDTCIDKNMELKKVRMAMGKASSSSLSNDGIKGAVGYASGSSHKNALIDIKKTFNCPLCNHVKDVGQKSLLEHVKSQHGHLANHRNSQVVCPICAAMPWGNPQQKSQDFVQHIQLRHRFEYDFYVDFKEDDDEALKYVLKKSMYET